MHPPPGSKIIKEKLTEIQDGGTMWKMAGLNGIGKVGKSGQIDSSRVIRQD